MTIPSNIEDAGGLCYPRLITRGFSARYEPVALAVETMHPLFMVTSADAISSPVSTPGGSDTQNVDL